MKPEKNKKNERTASNPLILLALIVLVSLVAFYPNLFAKASPYLHSLTWILAVVGFILVTYLFMSDWSAMSKAFIAPFIGRELECVISAKISFSGSDDSIEKLKSQFKDFCDIVPSISCRSEPNSLILSDVTQELMEKLNSIKKPEGVYADIEVIGSKIRFKPKN